MNTFKKILSLLSRQERRRGCLLLFMILIMAILDTMGVASIIPFLSVLGNPELVEKNHWLSMAYRQFGFTEPKNFLFLLGLVVFVVLFSSIAFKALTQWAMLRFTFMRMHNLSCRLLEGYLERPYMWYLNRNTADLASSILNETSYVVHQVIAPFMSVLAHGTLALFLIILLILINPFLASVVALILGAAYLFIYVFLRRYLARIGTDRVLANRERFRTAQEALSGLKEVKIFGREKAFYNRFISPSYRLTKHLANSGIAGMLPRYLLEVLAFGGILLITLYLFRAHEKFGLVLPTLGVYAFAGYKLLPALQQVFQNLTQFKFGLSALDALHKDILEFREKPPKAMNLMDEALFPKSAIGLEGIYFTYPNAKVLTLRDISLEIRADTTVGLVGSTGSGKTTLVDIILGLLSPDRGRVLVDGIHINSENVRSWQASLGYVPQNIFLVDDTVAANIAFGIPIKQIDMRAVENAAKIAELHDFVVGELPYGYETFVGERGVRLSGGQRQRIGIARALYHDPKVLVLDEATSALDNVTEKYVLQAIRRFRGERTIIIIAHRLTTVKNCDLIYLIDHGKVKDRGLYHELLGKSDKFRKMAEGVLHNL